MSAPMKPVVNALLFMGLLVFMAACSPLSKTKDLDAAKRPTPLDKHSYAKPDQARVRHIDLDLKVDFASQSLSGTATLALETRPEARQVILDTKDLKIEAVKDAGGTRLNYGLGPQDKILGRALTIDLPQGAQSVVITYRTTDKSAALQWLNPEQTSGKRHPFVFTQGQSILTRTWIPTQDSPGIRQTYKARLVVPKALKAVMAADMLMRDGEAVEGNANVRAYRFEMTTPIAPYLIAMAVGDIVFRPIGTRTGIYAEPLLADKAASEFIDLETMLETAEGLYGPYVWGRYDILIMPSAFPYGGMENPKLTFMTPTVLAGDRSLVALAAHEMAHSWSGNLVTNATWEDFWLNEGFTTYIEARIMEALYGPERADMLRVLGHSELVETMAEFEAKQQGNFTRLHPDLSGLDPEVAFSTVPYEKGAALLQLIEARVGRKRFDTYLKAYFGRHAFQSLTTQDFVDDIQTNLGLDDRIKLKTWLYDEGLPANLIVPKSEAFVRVDAAIADFINEKPVLSLGLKTYSTQEWLRFLQGLPQTLTTEQMKALESAYDLNRRQNAEIRFAWLRLVIAHRYEPGMRNLREFLSSQGRRKFVLPLYKDLMAQKGWGEAMARKLYKATRPGYHPVTQTSVDAVIKPE
jgi:leukotriene-A4 hydrolase